MKRLNITRKQYSESKYLQKKYGKLEYVSESGKVFKTSKGQLIRFVKESEDKKNQIESKLDELSKLVMNEKITLESVVKKLKRMGFKLAEYGGWSKNAPDYEIYVHKYGFIVNVEYYYKRGASAEDVQPSDFYWYEDLKFIMANWSDIIN